MLVPSWPSPEELLGSFAPPNWRVVRVGAKELGSVAMYLESAEASLRVRLSPRGFSSQTSLPSPVGDVQIDQLHGLTPGAARNVVRRAMSNAREFLLPLLALFPHLLLSPNKTDQDALAARLARVLATRPPWLGESFFQGPITEEDLFLDPPGLAAFLAPQFRLGDQAIAGYVFESITLPPSPRRTSLDLRSCSLTFTHSDNTRPLRVRMGAVDAIASPFAKANSIAVGLQDYAYSGVEDDVPIPVASLCAWLTVLIAVKLGGAHKMRVPRRVHEIRALAVPESAMSPLTDIDAAGTLHLHLDAECGQSCVFCPIKRVVPPLDEGDDELEALRLRMRAARTKGVTAIQLNGLDPLAFSRIMELIASVVDAGFVRLTLMGPARRFADQTFRRDLLARAPAETNIVVPLYGVTPQVHDDVTGRPGAHADVMAAIEGLLVDAGPTRVHLATVMTRANVHEWTSLVAFAEARGVSLFSQPVYPLRPNADETYKAAALPETTIVREVLRTIDVLSPQSRIVAMAALATIVRHPCIRYHEEKRNDEKVTLTQPGEPMFALAAVLRRSDASSESPDALGATTIPCADAGHCALAPSCPREHYAAYVELFGTNEFVPVSR